MNHESQISEGQIDKSYGDCSVLCGDGSVGAIKKSIPQEICRGTCALNPIRTAVPFWGQDSQVLCSLSPTRDCGPKRVKYNLSRYLNSKHQARTHLATEVYPTPLRVLVLTPSWSGGQVVRYHTLVFIINRKECRGRARQVAFVCQSRLPRACKHYMVSYIA